MDTRALALPQQQQPLQDKMMQLCIGQDERQLIETATAAIKVAVTKLEWLADLKALADDAVRRRDAGEMLFVIFRVAARSLLFRSALVPLGDKFFADDGWFHVACERMISGVRIDGAPCAAPADRIACDISDFGLVVAQAYVCR